MWKHLWDAFALGHLECLFLCINLPSIAKPVTRSDSVANAGVSHLIVFEAGSLTESGAYRLSKASPPEAPRILVY